MHKTDRIGDVMHRLISCSGLKKAEDDDTYRHSQDLKWDGGKGIQFFDNKIKKYSANLLNIEAERDKFSFLCTFYYYFMKYS